MWHNLLLQVVSETLPTLVKSANDELHAFGWSFSQYHQLYQFSFGLTAGTTEACNVIVAQMQAICPKSVVGVELKN